MFSKALKVEFYIEILINKDSTCEFAKEKKVRVNL